MTIDDDIIVPCSDIQTGLKSITSNPKNHIGYFPRLFLKQNDNIIYRAWLKVYLTSSFNIILTKASFLHHTYLDLYWRDDYKPIRDYVDKIMNCEDIAMAVLVEREGGGGRYLQGSLTDYGGEKTRPLTLSRVVCRGIDDVR